MPRTSGISEEISSTATPLSARSRDHPVDLDLGGDVDAARRLVEDEQLGVLDQQPFGEHHFLLVAAAKVGAPAAPCRPGGSTVRGSWRRPAVGASRRRSRRRREARRSSPARHCRSRWPRAPGRRPCGPRSSWRRRCTHCLRRRREIGGRAVEPHCAGCRRASAPKIALAISVRPLPTRPNMPTISPARTLKPTSCEDIATARVSRPPARGLPRRALALREDRRQRPADHGGISRVLVELGDGTVQHAAAVLEHHDAVGDLEDLLQAVRDVEDRGAGARRGSRTLANSTPVSAAESTAVGSSRIRICGSATSALAISTICCCATLSRPTSAVGRRCRRSRTRASTPGGGAVAPPASRSRTAAAASACGRAACSRRRSDAAAG